MKKKIINTIIISVTFLVTDICFSQNVDFKPILKSFKIDDYNKVSKNLSSIDTLKISNYDKATWYYYYADYQYRIDNHDIAFKFINKSKKIFINLNKIKDAIDCNVLALGILSHQNKLDSNFEKYLIEETEKFAIEKNDSILLTTVYKRIAAKFIHLHEGEKAIENFKKIIPIVINLNDSIRIAYCYDNIATAYKYTSPAMPDSTIYYQTKATSFYIKYKDYLSLAYNYNNIGQYYKSKKDYSTAIKYYKKADSIPIKVNKVKSKLIFYENISDTYHRLNDYKNEALFLKKINKLKDSINDTKQNIAISEINEKYDNEKLRADNLESEMKRKQSQSWLIASLLFIIVTGSIVTLQLKNSRRKRLLALQEKELETQKNLTLLKEQEITSINAMVEGQEKERKRVAEDLHDNLGSVIATLKLHFENLKMNREKKKIDQDTLFDKTEILIDEAYLKVRSIAHAKNAGVIANQGLLVAIQLMAEKISSANSIQIEVIDFGLEKPIENSLEISLFRIIQELVTNIIKHANATQATINISQDQDEVTILIEDNGIGMDVSQIHSNKGMGLHSIKTRVEHLEGNFTIDSTPTKGTTIIIQIPI